MPAQAFEVDTDQMDKLLHNLELGRRKALPFAVRQGLNDSAFFGKRVWVGIAHQQLTIRTTYVDSGMWINRATGLNLATMQSELGNTRPIMGRLETGGTQSDPRGVPIHTTVASGEGVGVRPRKKVVKRGNRLDKLRAYKVSRGGTQAQRNVIAIAKARKGKKRDRVAYLELGNRKGIYSVSKEGEPTLLIDLTRKSTVLPPHPTLRLTLDTIVPKLSTVHALALMAQLRRHGLNAKGL